MGSRDSVAVVVVARRRVERLTGTLAAIARQGSLTSVIVANLSGSTVSVPAHVRVLDLPPDMPLGDAVTRGIVGQTEDLVWILRDDTTPHVGALASLAAVFDTSPSAGIVGPKQLDAETPIELREMGESMSRSGFAVQLAEREMDQGQFDRVSDVLGVGEAGMLVRREVWNTLGGFDSALPYVDGALDFCYRARTAGWRVEVVPGAVIETRDSSLEAALGEVSPARVVREEAKARAHRVLAYLPGGLAMLRSITLVLGAFLRGVVLFIQKRSAAFAELGGIVAGATRGSAIAASRKAIASTTVQPIDKARLFVTRADMARRRALENDDRRAAREALDTEPRLGFGQIGLWLTVFAGIIGAVLGRAYLGATALSGGALVPLSDSLGRVWSAIGATWTPVAGGMQSTPDGFAAVVAGLSTVTWWDPNQFIVGLWILAIPLSFVAAWIGAGVFTVRTGTAVVIAGSWTLLPTLHIALAEGRLGAVLAHIVIPIAIRALYSTGIVSAGWYGLLAEILWASVPALAPIIVIATVARAIAGRPGILAALLPALALEWPRIIESASTGFLSYFADRGVPFLPVNAPSSLLALWPSAPQVPFVNDAISQYIVWGVVGAIVISALVAAYVGARRVSVVLTIGAIGVGVWTILGTYPLSHINGRGVGLFSGPLLDPLWFGLLAGAAITVTSVKFIRGFATPLVLLALTVVSASAIAAPVVGSSQVSASTVRTLPAYVEAETNANPGGGTLIITPAEDSITAEVQRDSGVTMTDWTATAATRTSLSANEPAIATLAGNLIVESGFDVTAAATENHISFVLLKSEPTNPAVSAISSHEGLTQVGVTEHGILWKVDAAASGDGHPTSRDLAYIIILAVVTLVTVIAAIPTTLPRRRIVEDDLVVEVGEETE